jgi:hypothetical protein
MNLKANSADPDQRKYVPLMWIYLVRQGNKGVSME